MMKIGELSKRTDVSKDAIRLYELKGLVSSTELDAGSRKYRDYPNEAIQDIQDIKSGQAAGFKLSELKPLIDKWNAAETDEQKKAVLIVQRDLVAHKVATLEHMVSHLNAKIEKFNNKS